jgi:hypothetical protein
MNFRDHTTFTPTVSSTGAYFRTLGDFREPPPELPFGCVGNLRDNIWQLLWLLAKIQNLINFSVFPFAIHCLISVFSI